MRILRRHFLKAAAAGTAAGAASCGGAKSRWRFFTIAEAQTLALICDHIIPPDEDPGAAAAGVVEFIDRQLLGHYREFQRTYREGIASLERLAVRTQGGRFAELDGGKQSELLAGIDENKLPLKELNEPEARPFFQMLIAHTMQGYYGNPRHGGNLEAVGWKVVGLPYPQLRGRHYYEFPKKS